MPGPFGRVLSECLHIDDCSSPAPSGFRAWRFVLVRPISVGHVFVEALCDHVHSPHCFPCFGVQTFKKWLANTHQHSRSLGRLTS